jgi:hypothetical protein
MRPLRGHWGLGIFERRVELKPAEAGYGAISPRSVALATDEFSPAFQGRVKESLICFSSRSDD